MEKQNPPPYNSAVGDNSVPYYPPAYVPQSNQYGVDPTFAPQPTSYGGNPPYPTNTTQPYPSDNHDSTPNDHQVEGMFALGFNEKSVRQAFIRKVFTILAMQLSVTVAFIAVFTLVADVKSWIQRNSWFYYISYAVFLVTYLTLVCCTNVRRRSPGNYIALGVFTLTMSYMAGTISSFYNTQSVLVAAAVTAAVCLFVSILAQTSFDFTACRTLLMLLSVCFIFTGIAAMIVYFVSPANFRILHMVYAGIGIVLFTLYLAYDMQTILGGRKHELSPEEYIYGALQLYLDIVNLFLLILSLFNQD